MKIVQNETRTPLCIGVGFLLCVVFVELIFIMLLNNGLLVYTLDDPYIHMALAENIKGGHYGINANEFSAPSSSILWPFIIAPFSSYECSPFFINLASAIATIFVLVKILNISFDINDNRTKGLFVSAVVIFFVLATNIVGLLFTGMEHSLQVLLVLLVAYGLIVAIEKKEIKWWFLSAIIFAPLVRYECIAISITALFYIAICKHLKHVVFAMVVLSVFFCGFALFLTSLGLDPFPTSVIVKSSVVQGGERLHSVIANLLISLNNRQGAFLSFGVLALLSYLFFGNDMKRKQLASVAVFAAFMHFIAGRYGWYHRYEIYIWSFILVVIIYVFAPPIKYFVTTKKLSFNPAAAIVTALGFTIITGAPYILGLFSLPIASNNIYEQQYQMHRFTVDYYNKSVAVNDLGYVSYKNNNYVLDLWGLGSKKALRYRINSNNSDWMKKISDESNVGLAMIYEDWFDEIPDEWIKIGELHLGKKQITPARSEVAFYATSQAVLPFIVSKLNLFAKTLPAGVKFTFQKNGC